MARGTPVTKVPARPPLTHSRFAMPVDVQELSALSLFADTPRAVVDALARRAIEVRFAPNEVIFLAGGRPRGWFIVLEGTVRVVRGSGGRQHVVHTEGPGGTLGEVPLFGGGTYPATVIAEVPTECLVLSLSAIEAAMARDS